jgi:predicted transcriptional regulator
LRTIRASSSERSSRSNLPDRITGTSACMSAAAMSVMKPSRPWLMPINGVLYGASWRPMPSIVPSPPSTTATSRARADFRRRERRIARDADLARGIGLEHDVEAEFRDAASERGERLGDAGRVAPADERNSLELITGFHAGITP